MSDMFYAEKNLITLKILNILIQNTRTYEYAKNI